MILYQTVQMERYLYLLIKFNENILYNIV